LGLSEREFKIVVATFSRVFPRMTIWANVGFEISGQVGYAALVAKKDHPLEVDLGQLARRLAEPSVMRDLSSVGMASPEEMLDLFVADGADVATWTRGLPVQTDDQAFAAYRTNYSDGRPMTPALLLALRTPIVPALVHLGPDAERTRRSIEQAYETEGFVMEGLVDRAAELNPTAAKVQLYLAQARRSRGYYEALARAHPDDPLELRESATELSRLGFDDSARASFDRLLELSPEDPSARLDRALLDLGTRDQPKALAQLARLAAKHSKVARVRYALGAARLSAGEPRAAIAELEAAVALDSSLLEAELALGRAQTQSGATEQAERTLESLAEREPWLAEAENELGNLARVRGDLGAAAGHLGRAGNLDPYRAAFREDLGSALAAKGAPVEAVRELL